MSNLILRSIKDRGEKIFTRISEQIRKDRLKSLYIFTGIIIIVITSYLIWFNFFNLHQVSQAPEEGENFLARITTGVRGAFADMFGLPDGNIIAEFPMRGSVAHERQRIENRPFVSIDKDSAYPGGKIVKSGSGFTLNGEIIIFSSSPSGENKSVAVFADQSGQFNYSYTIQPSAEAGVYQYWAEDKTTKFVTDRIRYLIVSVAQKDIAPEKVTEILADAAKEDDKEIPSLTLPKECSFSGAGAATSAKEVVLNEVAWMGSTEHHSNEWIELKNISSSEIDISGWWLIDQREQIKVVFPQNTIIPAGRFFLLERTDDDSVPNVRADMIYQGILSNDEEGLRLLNPDCLIKDEVLANPKWPAGEVSSRKTMERTVDLSGWQTSVFVNGTPKQRNSSGEVVLSRSGATTGGATAVANVSGVLESGVLRSSATTGRAGAGGNQTSTTVPPTTLCSQTNLSVPSKTILLNEIAWAGDDRSSSNEWIELYNPGDTAVSLTGWQLLDKAEDVDIIFDSADNISAGGYFLVLRSSNKINFIPGIQTDKFYTGAINNSNETLRLFNNNCLLVDEIIAVPDWKNIGGDTVNYRTAERTSSGWHTFSGAEGAIIMGTPKATNSKVNSIEARTISENQNTTISSSASPLQCSFSVTDMATGPKQVILSEIAWMGSTEHHSNEWIELKNISSSEVDISGWWLIDQGEQIKVVLSQNTRISAGDFFLLERTDNNSVPNILADLIYQGDLLDANEGLRLLSPNCLIQDEVFATPNWIAGERDSDKTMERRADLSSWQTSAVVNGTPKQRNSPGEIVLSGDNSVAVLTALPPEFLPNQPVEPVVIIVRIIEVIFNPEGLDDGRERVILKNFSDSAINLSNYSLQYLGQNNDFSDIRKRDFVAGNNIPSEGIFKIGMNCGVTSPCEEVNLSWSQALRNQSGTLFLVSHKNKINNFDDAGIVNVFKYPVITYLFKINNFTA